VSRANVELDLGDDVKQWTLGKPSKDDGFAASVLEGSRVFGGRFLVCLLACLATVAACSAEPPVALEPPAEPSVSEPSVGTSLAVPSPSSTLPPSTLPSVTVGGGSSATGEPPDSGGSAGEPPGGVSTSVATTIPEGGETESENGASESGGRKIESGVGEVESKEAETESGDVEMEPSGGESRGVFVDVSAGFGYSCGLREEGEVECWEWGRASVPPYAYYWWEREQRSWSDDPINAVVPGGEFSSVSAGLGNACGLRPSGVLVCWGRNRDVVVSPPEGLFTEVSVGFEHACGVRVDEKVLCWGSTSWRQPMSVPPEGAFVDFALGNDFGCGVRVGGSVVCWGENYTATTWGRFVGELPVPEGEVESVHAQGGRADVCGLRTDGRVECWGNFIEEKNYSYLSPPEGEFSSILFVGSFSCGLRPGGEGECWAFSGRSWAPPEPGDYPDAVYGEGNACGYFHGIRLCWESGADSPEEVTGIVEGNKYFCGLRPGGEAVCDYFDDFFDPHGKYSLPRFLGKPPVETPQGPFTVLTSGSNFVCGLRPGGEVECWGRDTYGQSSPPEGRFTQVIGRHDLACGLRPAGELECWGYGGYRSKIIPPRVPLTNVHAGWGLRVRSFPGAQDWTDWGFSCGLRSDQSIECWGDSFKGGVDGGLTGGDYGLTDTAITYHHPEGVFTAVGVGKLEACGLRPVGVVECWGPAWMYQENWEDWIPAHDIRDGGGEGYAALSVGGEYSCALLQDSGAVDCWSTDRSETYQLAGPYTAVSAGYGHQCGVLATGDIHCWEGKNPEERRWKEITFPAEGATGE